MILGPDGKPARTQETFISPAWALRQLSERFERYASVGAADERVEALREACGIPRWPQFGATITVKLPERFKRGEQGVDE